jgi:hypothetical protein
LCDNNASQELYADGKTGYEHYYTDVLSFWRDIYDPDPLPQYKLFNPAKLNETN